MHSFKAVALKLAVFLAGLAGVDSAGADRGVARLSKTDANARVDGRGRHSRRRGRGIINYAGMAGQRGRRQHARLHAGRV
jgi:hypothetical protein